MTKGHFKLISSSLWNISVWKSFLVAFFISACNGNSESACKMKCWGLEEYRKLVKIIIFLVALFHSHHYIPLNSTLNFSIISGRKYQLFSILCNFQEKNIHNMPLKDCWWLKGVKNLVKMKIFTFFGLFLLPT